MAALTDPAIVIYGSPCIKNRIITDNRVGIHDDTSHGDGPGTEPRARRNNGARMNCRQQSNPMLPKQFRLPYARLIATDPDNCRTYSLGYEIGERSRTTNYGPPTNSVATIEAIIEESYDSVAAHRLDDFRDDFPMATAAIYEDVVHQ